MQYEIYRASTCLNPGTAILSPLLVWVQLQDIVKHLREIPEQRLVSLLWDIAVERQKFAYRDDLQITPSATSIIMSRMCST